MVKHRGFGLGHRNAAAPSGGSSGKSRITSGTGGPLWEDARKRRRTAAPMQATVDGLVAARESGWLDPDAPPWVSILPEPASRAYAFQGFMLALGQDIYRRHTPSYEDAYEARFWRWAAGQGTAEEQARTPWQVNSRGPPQNRIAAPDLAPEYIKRLEEMFDHERALIHMKHFGSAWAPGLDAYTAYWLLYKYYVCQHNAGDWHADYSNALKASHDAPNSAAAQDMDTMNRPGVERPWPWATVQAGAQHGPHGGPQPPQPPPAPGAQNTPAAVFAAAHGLAQPQPAPTAPAPGQPPAATAPPPPVPAPPAPVQQAPGQPGAPQPIPPFDVRQLYAPGGGFIPFNPAIYNVFTTFGPVELHGLLNQLGQDTSGMQGYTQDQLLAAVMALLNWQVPGAPAAQAASQAAQPIATNAIQMQQQAAAAAQQAANQQTIASAITALRQKMTGKTPPTPQAPAPAATAPPPAAAPPPPVLATNAPPPPPPPPPPAGPAALPPGLPSLAAALTAKKQALTKPPTPPASQAAQPVNNQSIAAAAAAKVGKLKKVNRPPTGTAAAPPPAGNPIALAMLSAITAKVPAPQPGAPAAQPPQPGASPFGPKVRRKPPPPQSLLKPGQTIDLETKSGMKTFTTIAPRQDKEGNWVMPGKDEVLFPNPAAAAAPPAKGPLPDSAAGSLQPVEDPMDTYVTYLASRINPVSVQQYAKHATDKTRGRLLQTVWSASAELPDTDDVDDELFDGTRHIAMETVLAAPSPDSDLHPLFRKLTRPGQPPPQVWDPITKQTVNALAGHGGYVEHITTHRADRLQALDRMDQWLVKYGDAITELSNRAVITRGAGLSITTPLTPAEYTQKAIDEEGDSDKGDILRDQHAAMIQAYASGMDNLVARIMNDGVPAGTTEQDVRDQLHAVLNATQGLTDEPGPAGVTGLDAAGMRDIISDALIEEEVMEAAHSIRPFEDSDDTLAQYVLEHFDAHMSQEDIDQLNRRVWHIEPTFTASRRGVDSEAGFAAAPDRDLDILDELDRTGLWKSAGYRSELTDAITQLKELRTNAIDRLWDRAAEIQTRIDVGRVLLSSEAYDILASTEVRNIDPVNGYDAQALEEDIARAQAVNVKFNADDYRARFNPPTPGVAPLTVAELNRIAVQGSRWAPVYVNQVGAFADNTTMGSMLERSVNLLDSLSPAQRARLNDKKIALGTKLNEVAALLKLESVRDKVATRDLLAVLHYGEVDADALLSAIVNYETSRDAVFQKYRDDADAYYADPTSNADANRLAGGERRAMADVMQLAMERHNWTGWGDNLSRHGLAGSQIFVQALRRAAEADKARPMDQRRFASERRNATTGKLELADFDVTQPGSWTPATVSAVWELAVGATGHSGSHVVDFKRMIPGELAHGAGAWVNTIRAARAAEYTGAQPDDPYRVLPEDSALPPAAEPGDDPVVASSLDDALVAVTDLEALDTELAKLAERLPFFNPDDDGNVGVTLDPDKLALTNALKMLEERRKAVMASGARINNAEASATGDAVDRLKLAREKGTEVYGRTTTRMYLLQAAQEYEDKKKSAKSPGERLLLAKQIRKAMTAKINSFHSKQKVGTRELDEAKW